VEQLHHLYEETAEELPQSEENDREQKRLLEYLEGSITTKDFLQGSAHLHRKEVRISTHISVYLGMKVFIDLNLFILFIPCLIIKKEGIDYKSLMLLIFSSPSISPFLYCAHT
jgi:hypothetical protein